MEALLEICGGACFGALKWYDSRTARARFAGQLDDLLSRASVAADLTVTCELLFLRFPDRIISVRTRGDGPHRRLIARFSPDCYAVIDRYERSTDAPDELDRYTVTLFDAQYLGPHSFDRDGLRLTFGPDAGARVLVQRLSRRGDRLAAAVRDDPALNLQRGCQSIEYAAAPIPDPAAVTHLLEAAEPLTFDVIR